MRSVIWKMGAIVLLSANEAWAGGSLPLSDCTAITPPAASVARGSPSPRLTATCNNSPAEYIWKVDGNTLDTCTLSTCVVPASQFAVAGVYTVSVKARNADGKKGDQSASATITVKAQAKTLSACTAITPPSPFVAVGSASPPLTATCNSSPTSYIWQIGVTTLNCTGAKCAVPAANLPKAGSYTVTVKANNAVGAGTQTASATITVGTQALSACSAITPATPFVAVGSPSPLLKATCSYGPTAYVWKLGATTLNCSGATCTVPAANLSMAGTYKVTVTANNAKGAGTAAASAVLTVGTQALSACTAVTPPTSLIALGAAPPMLASTCSNAPTARVWKLGATTLNCTGATCTIPAASLSKAGTYTVTVSANNAAGAGTQAASATITVGAATACAQTLGVIPVDFAQVGNTKHVKMNRGQAIAFQVITDNSGKMGSFDTAQSTVGGTVFRFINVSRTKCDFSYANYDAGNGCAATGNYSATVNYTLGAAKPRVCKLLPNTAYFVNVRNENVLPATPRTPLLRGVDSCRIGTVCGFVFGVY